MQQKAKGLLTVALAISICSGTAFARQTTTSAAPASAQKAALAWLHLIDTQKYAASYVAAAAVFQSHVTTNRWQSAAASIRGDFGAFKSRSLRKVQKINELPDMPPGTYLILEYQSAFANVPRAVETAVLELDADKKWRISGYFVKQAP